MTRTIITIPQEDKRWLKTVSRLHQRSMAETIREAIHLYREQEEKPSYKKVVRETAGTWKGRIKGDSQNYVDQLRSEWEDRT